MSQSRLFDVLRAIGVDLRPRDVPAVAPLFLASFLLGVFQFSAKAVRQATYVDTLGAEQLPWVYLLVAVFAYPVISLYRLASERWARGWTVTVSAATSALLLLVFWAAMAEPSPIAALLFYLFFSIATVLLLSQLWSVANAVLDARQARRLFGAIGSGALLGGVLGGQVARMFADEPRHTLLVGAAALLLVVVLAHTTDPLARTARLGGPGAASTLGSGSGLALVLRSRHLRSIAAVLFVSVVVAQCIDLQFNWLIERSTETLAERAAAFGNLLSLMGLVAFVLQIVATGRIHRRFGVGTAMRVLPLFVLALSAAVLVAEAAFPAALLVLASVLKAGDVGLRYSLDHATRELLFVPAAPLARVRAKAYVDVLTHRLAEGVAAVVLLTVTVGWLEPLDTAWLVLALVAVWLVATVSAQRRYVEALQRRFNERAIDDGMALDVTEVGTLEMLIEALGSAESGHVLRALDLLASNQRGRLIPPLLLHHDDARVRLRTLEILRAEGRRDALALIEKCLGDDDGDVRAEAVQTLAVLLGAGGPDLMRSRLDDPDPRVRAAAVACLASFGDERDRTHAGLVVAHMACEDDPAARVQAAQALAQSPDQLFRGELVRLLYDRDWLVVRAALDAVRVRVERDGWNPIYVPILVSLLRHRRVKHEAREALVACGVDVVPALRHFLTDRGEQLWVRRALPKTLARFASQAALDALFAGLEGCDDRLFRRKSIEALARCPKLAAADRRLERVVHDECRQSLAALLDLLAVSAQGAFELSGPQLVWRESPTLLQRLLDERRRDHLENALRLVALRVEGAEAARAREHLLGEDASRRMQAIELLDNLTPAPLRRPLMVVIDDLDAGERRALAERVFGLPQRGADEVWRELLAADDQQDIAEGAAWLASAAIAEVSARELRSLYPLVRRLAERGAGVARETARWALESVTLATAPPLRIAPLSAGEAASRRGAP